MLSSNSSSCNPFPENDLTSKSDPNFLFTFPASPNLQYDDVSYFLDTFCHTTTTAPSAAAWHHPTTPVAAAAAQNHNPTAAATAAVKKDRHSKINTARGPRDRRMRLSLDIARKFFDLQDLLGYDKASRTVDWLLRSSRNAIRELQRATSCTSEECSSTTALATAVVEEEGCCSKVGNGRSKRGRGVVQPKRASVGRESRKKARDRARERTSQKRRLMRENGGVFGECRHFPAAAEELSSDEARANEGVFFFDFNHHNENNSAAFLHQDEQIAEFQFNGKPWEAYNSFSLS